MKRQLRTLTICACGLALLIAALLAILYWLPQSSTVEPQAESPDPKLALLALAEANIRSIVVQHPEDTITAERGPQGLIITELEGYPVDQSAVSALVSRSANLTATRLIAEGQVTLADYGLDKPRAAVTVSAEDGQEYQFSLGAEAPASLGTYVLMDEAVYLVEASQLAPFMDSLIDYVSLAVTEPLDAASTLSSIQLSRDGETVALTYIPEQNVSDLPGTATPAPGTGGDSTTAATPAYYRMSAPVAADIPIDRVSTWSHSLSALTAQSVVALSPDDAQLAALGFRPAVTVSYVTSDGDRVSLHAAPAEAGAYHLMRAGVDILYKVNEGQIPWVKVTARTLLETLFPGVEPADLESITITPDEGQAYRLVRTAGGFTNNGTSITQSEFEAVTEAVLHIQPGYAAPTDPGLSPVLSIELRTTDGSLQSVELTPSGQGSLYASLAGSEITYTCEESIVRTLLELCAQADGQ